MNTPANILFLCTGNSCRSQMAEGFANAMHSDVLRAYSAGTAPGPRVDPRAVQVMGEVGIDISAGQPKHVNELDGVDFDLVVTVCDHAHETCPVFPGANTRIVHHGFDDPPRLAFDAGSEDEAIEHYRRVRDEIRAFIETLPESLHQDESKP
jgi:arsenate reductase